MSGGAAPDLINPVGIAPYPYEDGAKPVAIVSWPATQAARHFVLRPRTRAAKRSHRNAGFLACRNTVSVFAIRTSVPSPGTNSCRRTSRHNAARCRLHAPLSSNDASRRCTLRDCGVCARRSRPAVPRHWRRGNRLVLLVQRGYDLPLSACARARQSRRPRCLAWHSGDKAVPVSEARTLAAHCKNDSRIPGAPAWPDDNDSPVFAPARPRACRHPRPLGDVR